MNAYALLSDHTGRALREPVLPERLLAKLWRAKTGETLPTTDGRSVRVVYPGRPAQGHGPDFQDAVLYRDGRTVNGPVELHRVPSDWKANGHHHDAAYDNVVLHVVASAPETVGDSRAKGDADVLHAPAMDIRDTAMPAMPMVILPAQRKRERRRGEEGLLHELAALGADALRASLRAAGVERFEERVSTATVAIAARGVEQVLMAGIMDCLGYSENRAPFQELARRVPIHVLRATAGTVPPDQSANLVASLLLGGPGLEAPTREWVQFIGTPPMDPASWRTSGVRPSNHPRRRLIALARYVTGATRGLAAWLLPPALVCRGALSQALIVRLETGGALVGESRAKGSRLTPCCPSLPLPQGRLATRPWPSC
jgi:hypothetical protein